jgi:hypothetical protein
MAEIQFKVMELKQKTQDAQQQGMIDVLAEKMDVLKEYMKLANNREERASREKIEQNKLDIETMNLAEGALIHPLAGPVAQEFVRSWPQISGPSRGRII